MKWGIGLLNTQYIFSQCPPQLSDSKTSTQYRLTIHVAQFTVVSESRNESYNTNVLWASLSRLIPHVIDPPSIGKAVQ